jgi:Tol biopolymer transport system component
MRARRSATALLTAALATGLLATSAHSAARPKIDKVSRAANGGQTNGSPGAADISADGRWVVFASGASNIVRSDTNNEYDVFLFDRRTGRVRNLTAGGDGASDAPRISADGRRVVFVSLADNLVQASADPTASSHTFVWTRGGGIEQVDVAADGGAPNAASLSPDISADGKVVVFASRATDLASGPVTQFLHVYRRALAAGTIVALEGSSASDATAPSIDADGDRVAFSSLDDVLLWRRGQPIRNLTPTPGIDGDRPSISGDGKQVAFENADGVQLVDVKSRRVRPVAGGSSSAAVISDDGKHITFDAEVDLVLGDDNQVADAYVWSATTNRVTRLSGGAAAGSGLPRPSRDGSLVVFVSDDLLVEGDTNKFRDVFVRRLG